MRRVIALCGLLAACHASGGAKPLAFGVETWEVKNDTPCDAPVRIQSYGGQVVRSLGTVPAGTTQFFEVHSTLMKSNYISAYPIEPDGRVCRNNQNFDKRVTVRQVVSQ